MHYCVSLLVMRPPLSPFFFCRWDCHPSSRLSCHTEFFFWPLVFMSFSLGVVQQLGGLSQEQRNLFLCIWNTHFVAMVTKRKILTMSLCNRQQTRTVAQHCTVICFHNANIREKIQSTYPNLLLIIVTIGVHKRTILWTARIWCTRWASMPQVAIQAVSIFRMAFRWTRLSVQGGGGVLACIILKEHDWKLGFRCENQTGSSNGELSMNLCYRIFFWIFENICVWLSDHVAILEQHIGAGWVGEYWFICIIFAMWCSNWLCFKYTMGSATDSISLRVFLAVLISDGLDRTLQRALAHRMFMFDERDRWWILDPVTVNHNIIVPCLWGNVHPSDCRCFYSNSRLHYSGQPKRVCHSISSRKCGRNN